MKYQNQENLENKIIFLPNLKRGKKRSFRQQYFQLEENKQEKENKLWNQSKDKYICIYIL